MSRVPILTDHTSPPKLQGRRAAHVRPILNLKRHRDKAGLTQAELVKAADFRQTILGDL
jgi:DNA-binding XRE family transcriptional regulator